MAFHYIRAPNPNHTYLLLWSGIWVPASVPAAHCGDDTISEAREARASTLVAAVCRLVYDQPADIAALQEWLTSRALVRLAHPLFVDAVGQTIRAEAAYRMAQSEARKAERAKGGRVFGGDE